MKELECDKNASLLVLNKVDKVTDRTALDVLVAHHPKAICASALTGEGIESLTETVVEMLSRDFVDAEIVTPTSNGKAIAYLNAHAEIYRQEYRDDDVVYRCVLSKHLVHHVRATGAEVTVLK